MRNYFVLPLLKRMDGMRTISLPCLFFATLLLMLSSCSLKKQVRNPGYQFYQVQAKPNHPALKNSAESFAVKVENKNEHIDQQQTQKTTHAKKIKPVNNSFVTRAMSHQLIHIRNFFKPLETKINKPPALDLDDVWAALLIALGSWIMAGLALLLIFFAPPTTPVTILIIVAALAWLGLGLWAASLAWDAWDLAEGWEKFWIIVIDILCLPQILILWAISDYY